MGVIRICSLIRFCSRLIVFSFQIRTETHLYEQDQPLTHRQPKGKVVLRGELINRYGLRTTTQPLETTQSMPDDWYLRQPIYSPKIIRLGSKTANQIQTFLGTSFGRLIFIADMGDDRFSDGRVFDHLFDQFFRDFRLELGHRFLHRHGSQVAMNPVPHGNRSGLRIPGAND